MEPDAMDTTTTHAAQQGDDHEENENENELNSQGEAGGSPSSSHPSSPSEYSGSSDEETALPEKKSNASEQAHSSDEGRLSFSYEAGERILAYHQSLIYEAKVLKTSFANDSEGRLQPMYYIHYQGWKDRWDEWVDDSRVMKYNEKTLQLQRQVSEERKRMLQSKKSSTPASGSKKRDATGLSGAKAKKTKTNVYAPPPKPTSEQIAAFQLDIPEALKAKLVSDYQLVVRQKNLVPLPRQPTVGDLVDEFIDSFSSSPDYDEVVDIMEGLRTLFDKALGNMLLYRFERLQYLEISQRFPGRTMSDIYGPEHLLRFLMKLPELLAESSAVGPDRLAIKYQANRLVRWLAPKLEAAAPYQPATPLYIRQAEA